MTTEPAAEQPAAKPDTAAGVRKRLVQIAITFLLYIAILFGSSGRLDWTWAWVYLGLYVGCLVINAAIILRRHPELAAERARFSKDAKAWDKVLATLVGAVGPLAILLVAGLDVRFGWTQRLDLAVQLATLLVLALGYALSSWAMASNRFYSGLVRIQKERGHAVETGGPYRFVRHPGYVGFIIFTLATPPMLGSLWALVPAGLAIGVMVVRTALEDRTLLAELDGYANYTARVRCRLLPGVW